MPPEIVDADAVFAAPVESLSGRALVVLLHGFGSHERDLLPFAEVAPQGDAVVALRAPVDLGGGYAWVLGSPEVVLAGTGLDEVTDGVLRWLDRTVAALGAPTAVRLVGFSQGGALALTVLRRAPARIDGVAVLSGFVPAGLEAGDADLVAHPRPVLWVRGGADPVIPPEAIRRTQAWLPGHARLTEVVVPGLGHGVDATGLGALQRFLEHAPAG